MAGVAAKTFEHKILAGVGEEGTVSDEAKKAAPSEQALAWLKENYGDTGSVMQNARFYAGMLEKFAAEGIARAVLAEHELTCGKCTFVANGGKLHETLPCERGTELRAQLEKLKAEHPKPRKCRHKNPLLNADCLECAKEIIL